MRRMITGAERDQHFNKTTDTVENNKFPHTVWRIGADHSFNNTKNHKDRTGGDLFLFTHIRHVSALFIIFVQFVTSPPSGRDTHTHHVHARLRGRAIR